MAFLNSGYAQDGLKFIVYLIPLVYLIVKRDRLELKYFWLFLIGLSLLSLGHFADLLDEVEFLRRLFPSKGLHSLQDFFEDVVGMTLGFAVFILALYLELKEKYNKKEEK